MRWLRRLLTGLPDGFAGELAEQEHVVATCPSRGGHVVVTSLGLWLPGDQRVGWHLISKATWDGSVLVVVVAVETGAAGGAVLLADQPARGFPLDDPGRVPEAVHRRVTGSIVDRHRHALPGGGAWFVRRRVPGRDGVVLQVRADAGTDAVAVATLAAKVAARLN